VAKQRNYKKKNAEITGKVGEVIISSESSNLGLTSPFALAPRATV